MKEEISEEQRADYLDAFNMFDNNQDGTITREKGYAQCSRYKRRRENKF